MVEHWAEKYRVNPNLIAAVIYVESRGYYNVIGKAGEVGLMQIIPSDNTIRLDLAFPEHRDRAGLLNPENNIADGTRILAKRIQYYSGDVRSALGSYNCGITGLARNRCGTTGGYAYADVVLAALKTYGKCP